MVCRMIYYLYVRDNITSSYCQVMGSSGVIIDGTLLGMAGDPFGETHSGHPDVGAEAISDRAFVSVDHVGPLQGFLLAGGRVVFHYQAAGFSIPVIYDELDLPLGVGWADVAVNDVSKGVLVFFVFSMKFALKKEFDVIRGVVAGFLLVPSVHGSFDAPIYIPIRMAIINEDLGNSFQFSMSVNPRGAVRESSPDEGADGRLLISLGALALSV